MTITVSNKVWYVKNNVAGPGSGTSSDPFKTLAGAAPSAENSSAAGDVIFVFNGDGTNANQNAGITLKSGQQLIGQGVALVVGSDTLAPAGTKPQISNTTAAGDAITLADGNTVKGLTLTGATRDGINGTSHAGFTGDTLPHPEQPGCRDWRCRT